MSSFLAIPAGWVDSYSPVTSRLLLRALRNIRASAVIGLYSTNVSGSMGGPVPQPWETVATVRLFCPWAGPVRLQMYCSGVKGTGGQAEFRIRDSDTGSTSQEVFMSANTTAAFAELVLDFTGTADTIRTIQLQGTILTGSDVITVRWPIASTTDTYSFFKVNR